MNNWLKLLQVATAQLPQVEETKLLSDLVSQLDKHLLAEPEIQDPVHFKYQEGLAGKGLATEAVMKYCRLPAKPPVKINGKTVILPQPMSPNGKILLPIAEYSYKLLWLVDDNGDKIISQIFDEIAKLAPTLK